MSWVYSSMVFFMFFCQMTLYMPAAAAAVAMLGQSRAAIPAPLYPYQGRAERHGNRSVLTSLALSKRRGGVDGGESLALHLRSSCSTHDLARGEIFWVGVGVGGGGGVSVAVIGTVIKHQPSFPPQPPRNCLTVQFLPYVHVLFSRLPLSAQLVGVWLRRYFFSLFLAVTSWSLHLHKIYIGEWQWC